MDQTQSIHPASQIQFSLPPSSSPDHVEQYTSKCHYEQGYHASTTAMNHMLPKATTNGGPPAKQRKISKSAKRKGIIAIVPPSSASTSMAGAPPQTPPPSASKKNRNRDGASAREPATPGPASRQSTGTKTVPNAFVTPQSAQSKSQNDFHSAHGTWPSSSPARGLEDNALGISVFSSQQAHDVDPTLIYPDSYHGRDAHPTKQYNSYTTLFRSPIQYPPYLGKRSLSDFVPLSSTSKCGSNDMKSFPLARSSGAEPPSTPVSASICFEISEAGQAVVRQSSPVTPGSRQRMLSSSTSVSLSTLSSSSGSLSPNSDLAAEIDSDISEAETEIYNDTLQPNQHSDARIAMAKAIRRQQIQLRQEYERRLGQLSKEKHTEERRLQRRLKKLKRHASHNDAITGHEQSRSESTELRRSVSKPVTLPLNQFHYGPPSQDDHFSGFHGRRADMENAQSAYQMNLIHQPHEMDQRQLQQHYQYQQQHQHQQHQDHMPNYLMKRKRDQPAENQYQQQQREVEEDEGVTRCLCGTTEWLGEPMIQCDSCACWLHMGCVRLDPRTRIIGAWYCPICSNTVSGFSNELRV
ncbi:hypothetical protein V1512DRAFT_271466 [Lipomyces arxii]|uniref:uncharacterized protein n=1 Tax=Lipomyces arxii TaxID=56418 RepID=UPI0034CDCCC4